MAPTALRMPISRVRSVTETSMMFIMPMLPTSSEMLAMAPRKMVSMPVTCWTMPTICSWVMIMKSSFPSSVMRWRWVRRCGDIRRDQVRLVDIGYLHADLLDGILAADGLAREEPVW